MPSLLTPQPTTASSSSPPFLRVTECSLLHPSHCQLLTKMIQYKGKLDSPPPRFSLESNTGLATYYYNFTTPNNGEVAKESLNVSVFTYILRPKPKSDLDANASISSFLKNHEHSRRCWSLYLANPKTASTLFFTELINS